MARESEAVVKFKADISEFIANTQKVIDQLRVISEVRPSALGGLTGVHKDINKEIADMNALADSFKASIRALETYDKILARVSKTQKTVTLTREERLGIGQPVDELDALGRDRFGISHPARQPVERIRAHRERALALGNFFLEQRKRLEEEIEALGRSQADIGSRLLQIATNRQFVEERIHAIITGQAATQIVEERIRQLELVREKLIAARAEVESQVARQLGGTGSRAARDQLGAEAILIDARRKLEGVNRTIANLELQASREGVRGTQQELRIQEAISRQRERQALLIRQITNAEGVRGDASRLLGAGAVASGAQGQLEEFDRQLLENEEEIARTRQEGIARVAPEYERIRKALAANLAITERTDQVNRDMFKLFQQMEDLQRAAPGRGLQVVPDAEELRQQQLAALPGLERTLFNAFDDVGRRFRTALQFAISGAIIFGAQQLVREFFQAAVQVERTFADIESALEFDIEAERGTVQFRATVETIRRDVLQLANEFNVLPNVANEAAFKMVARFEDSANALKAIRAQFLATKISTIDQAEALRALTATAEGFAAAVLESNNNLTFQERLLERERVAADGYAAALDEAVLIQQRFGIEVEDTLEGTARAAETFRQLGFTRQQTEAAVAAVSFQLGQTGVNVAERLNRAFGGITQPEIRDALLELAAASEDFNLTLADFGSGAEAVRALDAQIRQLEQRDPQVALRIRDILGQRRETEVVAAFFGTADLRRSIEASLGGAAGAAERRFGFLAVTISEQIQSIFAEFQSLAQNFERLGLLSPIKVFLGGLNQALVLLNSVIQALDSVFLALDKVGQLFGVNLGTGLKNLIVLAGSLLLILRSIVAASAVIGVVRAGAAGVAARGGVGAAAGTAAAVVAPTFLQALAPVFGNLKTQAALAGGGIKGMAAAAVFAGNALRAAALAAFNTVGKFALNIPGVARLASVIGTSTVAIGGVVTGLIAAGLTIQHFVEEGAKSIEALREFALTGTRAEVETRAQERIQEFATPEQRAIFKAERELAGLRLQSTENVRTGFSTFMASMAPLFDKATRENTGIINSFISQALVGIQTDEKLIPNSQQWWEERIKESEEAWREAQLREVEKGIARLRGEDLTGDQQQAAGQFAQQFSQAQQALAAADTPAELEAAGLLIEDLGAAWVAFMGTLGFTIEGIEGSTKELLARGKQIDQDLAVNRLTPQTSIMARRRLITDLQAQLDNIKKNLSPSDTDGQEQIDQIQDEIDRQRSALLEQQLAGLQRQRDRLSLIKDPAIKLAREIEIVNRQILILVQNDQTGSEAYLDAIDERAALQAEAAQVEHDAAIAVAQHNVEMARTLEEYLAAVAVLNGLIQSGIEIVGAIPSGIDAADRKFFPSPQVSPEAAREAQQEVEKNNREVENRLLEERKRLAEARNRLAGPIRSRIAQINAQIAVLRVQIAAGFESPGEALLAEVQLRELIADRAEAAQEAAAAFTRSQVGVNNSIRGLQAELAITARQLELTARLYGKSSAEFFNLKITQDRLRNELISAQLELEDLNRRLGTDITNDFAQAQLDLVEVLRRMSQLQNLGPLEKARLELERRQAQARAQRAFFDDRLFQLRFAFETGEIGLSSYISSLQRLLRGVDTSTTQGKEIFLEISNLIDSLTEDVSDMVFNVPEQIRLPTIFEIRRAMAADQLGVNYMDNRVQTVTVEVGNTLEFQAVLNGLDQHFGSTSDLQFRRQAVGGATITPGGF